MPLPRMLTIFAALAVALLVGAAGYLLLRPPLPLLRDATFESISISPNADGQDDITFITYRLARPAQISIYLDNAAGERYYFRRDERRIAGDYRVAFSGVVGGYARPGEDIPGTIETRLIPNGQYTWTIAATNEDERVEKTGALAVVKADTALPVIRSFEIAPDVFTPNQDGIGDRVNVNVYLEKDAALQVFLEDEQGLRIYPPERERGRDPAKPAATSTIMMAGSIRTSSPRLMAPTGSSLSRRIRSASGSSARARSRSRTAGCRRSRSCHRRPAQRSSSRPHRTTRRITPTLKRRAKRSRCQRASRPS